MTEREYARGVEILCVMVLFLFGYFLGAMSACPVNPSDALVERVVLRVRGDNREMRDELRNTIRFEGDLTRFAVHNEGRITRDVQCRCVP